MEIFQGLAGELVNVLREAGQTVPEALMKFGTHVKKKVHFLLYFPVNISFVNLRINLYLFGSPMDFSNAFN